MRILLATPAFIRMSHDFIKKNPYLKNRLLRTLKLLEKDVFFSTLKTHKLHGSLKELYACRISFDYRIVFSFNNKNITLHGVGSHADLY